MLMESDSMYSLTHSWSIVSQDSDNKSSLVNFTDDEVYDFVCTCQDFASNNPEKMEEILSNNPSMVRGLLEAFDEMDVLSEKVQGMELHSRFN